MHSANISAPGEKPKIRVGVISSAPAPYRKGLFERLAQRPDIDLMVYYLGKTCGVWNWDTEIGGGFPQEFLELPRIIPRDKYSLWVHPQIPRTLEKGHFDVVVIGGYFIPSLLLSIAWCRMKGVPYILWSESHGGMQRSALRSLMRPILVNPIVKGAAAYLAVSSGARELLMESGASRDRIFLVLNSPDVDRISREVAALRPGREQWKRDKKIGGGPVGLFVGRMSPEKGLDDLLDACSISAKRGLQTGPLILVGRGEMLDGIRDRVRREGLNNVHIAGFVSPERICEYYAAADFLALPSRHEPFGAVVHEALAAGLPVIVSSAVGAASELVIEGKTGYIVPAGDPEKLAEKMLMLWNDFALGAKMADDCIEVAREFDHNAGEREFMRAVSVAIGAEGTEDIR